MTAQGSSDPDAFAGGDGARISPVGLRVIVAGLAIVALAVGVVWRSGASLSLVPATLAWSGLAAVTLGSEVFVRRAAAIAGGAAIVSMSATAGLVAADRPDPATMLGTVTFLESLALLGLVALTARYAQPSRAAVATLLTVGAIASANALRFGPLPSTAVAVLGTATWTVVVLIAAGVGVYLRSLDRQRARSVRHAQQAQRVRLARDLHDFVAHDVSEMLAQAQAGQVLATEAPALAEMFARIEDAGQRALRSLDETVHMLGAATGAEIGVAGGGPRLGELPALARRFADAERVDVTFELARPLTWDDVATLPPDLSAALYRVGVEALTNVRRHAIGVTRVAITVGVTGPAAGGRRPCIELCISNDGSAGSANQPRRLGGLGLAGLAELLRLLGGTLDAGPQPPGWLVRARVPLPARPRRRRRT